MSLGPRTSPNSEQPLPATGWEGTGTSPALGTPLTGRQMLESKSGQVMLETEEMSWLWIFTQLKKVQLFVGSLLMSPGCRAEGSVVRAQSHQAGDTQEGPRDSHQPVVHRHVHILAPGTCRRSLIWRKDVYRRD